MSKKLLFVTNNLMGGGAEKVLQTILCNLDIYKYDITVYAVNSFIPKGIYPDGIKLRHIFKPTKSRSRWKKLANKCANKFKLAIYSHFSSKTFYRLFIRGKYDTEIAFIEGYATRIVSGSTNKRSKKLAWLHIDLFNNHWTKIAYKSDTEEQQCYSKFDTIAAVSIDTAKSIKKLFPDLSTKIKVVHNPIDEKLIVSKSLEQNVVLPNAAIKLISVGRLVHQKGYDRLLPIIKRLIDEGHNISLTILGDGSDRKMIETFIKDNNLGDRIILPGFVSNPYPWMRQADLFVCSSRSEGYSTVVTEALILGLPVVTTECSGMREIFGDSNCGIICENNDESLYHSLSSILCTDLNTHKIPATERAKIFSIKILLKDLERIINN